MSPIRALISPKGLYKDHETSSGLPQAGWDPAADIPGRLADLAPGGGLSTTAGRAGDTVLSIPGPGCQQGEINPRTHPMPVVPGIYYQNPTHDNPPAWGETEKDQIGIPVSSVPGINDH